MTIKVLFSAPYMLPVQDRFNDLFREAGIELMVAEVEERLSEQELLPYAGQIDGAVCGDDRFTRLVLERAAPRLKVISKWGTGIDSIDREAALEFGVQVCNTPDAFTDAVADSVLAYMLSFARKTPWMDQALKAGDWRKIPGQALNELTLGVVGVGRIGSAVLRRAQAFRMRLLGNDVRQIPAATVSALGVEMLPLEDLLARSDFVSINCDLNPTSRHLFGRVQFQRMLPHAVLINTARGPVVDEAALVAALQQGDIAGAGLDVFEEEPLPPDSPLRAMPQVLLAAHNANSSPAAWERVHRNTLRNLFLGLGLDLPEALAGDP